MKQISEYSNSVSTSGTHHIPLSIAEYSKFYQKYFKTRLKYYYRDRKNIPLITNKLL